MANFFGLKGAHFGIFFQKLPNIANSANENEELSFAHRIKKKINEASIPKTTEGPPTKKSIQS